MLSQLLCCLGRHQWRHLRSVGKGKSDRKGNYQNYVMTEQCESCQITRKREVVTRQPAPVRVRG